MIDALDIWVKGVVQGVGFRPFVYRLAKRYLINGWVMNGVDGVHIHAEGESDLLDEFVMEISENAPAAAQVIEIEMHEVPLEPFDSFEIRFSDDSDVEQTTLVSPDLATCSDCERELFDETNRRYRYPFINCTNCGPRFTIINELPYDRANTSMCKFEMCDACSEEYADPEDRRFHAQPDSCFDCGPALTWRVAGAGAGATAAAAGAGAGAGASAGATAAAGGASAVTGAAAAGGAGVVVARTREATDSIFAEAARLLMDGKILAVKGLGGFHLVCDANNPQAIARLRERKHRDGKPLAVMVESLLDAHKVCHVSNEEAAILQGAVRPIVLLRKRANAHFATGLADKLPELGVMLPYTPVQHILLHDFAETYKAARKSDEGHNEDSESSLEASSFVPMLVMTSGNVHDEPIVINDEEAYQKLDGIADAFLGNNREIVSRFDDSVVRVIRAGEDYAIQFVRRSRGYAPAPIELKLPRATAASSQTIFATGAEQKNTFAFLRQSFDSENATEMVSTEAFVSQHIGDMENAETFNAWLEAKDRFAHLFDLAPCVFACDMHPEYLTSKWINDQVVERPQCERANGQANGQVSEHGRGQEQVSEQECEQARLQQTSMSQEVVKVQHHHAHIVSAMAENGITDACLGIAFDGTGFGVDGNIWGGEVLLSNLTDFERFANFAYVPMPGGAAAIKNPLRMAYGVLWEYDLLEHAGATEALSELGADQAELCEKMIEQGINTPVTSSVGRLFDAASALLGVCRHPAYEGEAAILLEAALWEWLGRSNAQDGGTSAGVDDTAGRVDGTSAGVDDAAGGDAEDSVEDSATEGGADTRQFVSKSYAINVVKNTATSESTAQDTSVLLYDAEPAFKSLLQDKQNGVEVGEIAFKFHEAFVGAIVQVAQLAEALYGIKTVVLTGGVFMNRYLIERSIAELSKLGFTVAINRELPPNDGCISLGQAVVAAGRHS